MKKQGMFSVGASLLLCCLFQGSAQAALDVANQEQVLQNQDVPVQPDGQPIEEIEVIGQASSIQLRMEIQRLEAGMFALFNELNSTDDFDVTCRNVTALHTGSRIPIWECEPAYLTKARHDNTYAFLTLGMELKDDVDLMFEKRDRTEQLNVEIRQLALEHPELAKAMLELQARKQKLAEREQRLREERGFLGGLSRNKDDAE